MWAATPTGMAQPGGVAEPLGRFLWSWPKKASQTPKGKPLWVRMCAGEWFYLGGSTYRRWYPLVFTRLGCGLFRATALCAGALTWVFSWAATRPGGATRGGLQTSWGAFFGLGQRKPPRPRKESRFGCVCVPGMSFIFTVRHRYVGIPKIYARLGCNCPTARTTTQTN